VCHSNYSDSARFNNPTCLFVLSQKYAKILTTETNSTVSSHIETICNMLAIERRDYILEELHKTGRVRVTDLSSVLGVSRMTIHRDLDALVQEGLVEKVFGGAVLPEARRPSRAETSCALCGRPVSARTRVVLHTRSGEQIEACCPHCALLLMETREDVVSGMGADFIHGQMINLKTATFLVNPEVTVCCTPSVLCFDDEEEARRFQQGFHGQLAALPEARKLIVQAMELSD
jgi:DNA-binding transcriptional ArsR family regulator